jgi:hypothetical protein
VNFTQFQNSQENNLSSIQGTTDFQNFASNNSNENSNENVFSFPLESADSDAFFDSFDFN